MYRVSVDPGRCQGHARCITFAPDVFDFDDEGYAFVPEDKSRYTALTHDVELAVKNCPERAILVSEEPEA
jgi:ferredoxin